MEASKEELLKVAEIVSRLRNIVGPIIPSALATLDGWTWKTEVAQERTLLTRGTGPIPLIPGTSIQGERGWINSFFVVFSDPESIFRFNADQWSFQASPLSLNTLNLILPNNATVHCNIYNPATLMGPLYGIVAQPSQFWPYKTQVRLTVEHPDTALTATSQVVTFGVGRHYISNEKFFYESILREGARQSIGRVQIPYRMIQQW